MSLRKYFKPKDSLPDPKGSLSKNISSSANLEVAKAMESSIIYMVASHTAEHFSFFHKHELAS